MLKKYSNSGARLSEKQLMEIKGGASAMPPECFTHSDCANACVNDPNLLVGASCNAQHRCVTNVCP